MFDAFCCFDGYSLWLCWCWGMSVHCWVWLFSFKDVTLRLMYDFLLVVTIVPTHERFNIWCLLCFSYFLGVWSLLWFICLILKIYYEIYLVFYSGLDHSQYVVLCFLSLHLCINSVQVQALSYIANGFVTWDEVKINSIFLSYSLRGTNNCCCL